MMSIANPLGSLCAKLEVDGRNGLFRLGRNGSMMLRNGGELGDANLWRWVLTDEEMAVLT